MSATIHTFQTRTRPQLLVEAPVDTRTPLMKRLDVIQERSERPRLKPVSEVRDPYKWRRIQLQRTGAKCPRCLGKKWVPAYTYAHVDDFVDCPLCTPVSPVAGVDYPTADDATEVPF